MTASDGMSWLDGVRAALDEADTPRRFFFRDDDAGWRDDRLREVFGCFQAHGIPLDVAVIPAELSPELTRELRARVSAGGVRVHQHGYAHVNHELTGRKCEFGPGRTPAAIADDLADGQRRMRDAFGSHADAVFTPPWNRCEPAVADTLVSLGFEVLSCDSTAPTLDRPDIAEVPVTVDWFGHHKGTRWDRDQLGEVIAGSIRRDRAVGVMLHHAVTEESDLEAVDQLLSIVASHPLARPITMMSLARRPAQAP